MPTVTYRHQPGIHATRGTVPLKGTSHLYRVSKRLWPEAVETVLAELLIPRSLHVCCGQSQLGDVRVDLDRQNNPNVIADANALPFPNESFESILCDPPYNGKMRWNHDMLTELSRVAKKRIIFQHWFLPVDAFGRWRKKHSFQVSEILVWAPKTYFGRAQVITVVDRV